MKRYCKVLCLLTLILTSAIAAGQEADDQKFEIGTGANVLHDSIQFSFQVGYKYYKKDWLFYGAKAEFWIMNQGKIIPVLAGIGIDNDFAFQYSLYAGLFPAIKENSFRTCMGFNPTISYPLRLDDHFWITLNVNYYRFWYKHHSMQYLDFGIGLAF